jgi:cysteine desulfurase
VEAARAAAARLLGAEDPSEIVFTSGATESNNLALRGVAEANRARGSRIVTVATEHRAVLDPAARLAREGFDVAVVPATRAGLPDMDALAAAIVPGTILVSVMAANNETGAMPPLAEIGALCEARGALLHSDATQAVGKVPFDVKAQHVHLASLSAHKLYGPKGVGALYVRRRNPRVRLAPLTDGGGHERGLRSGTLNVPGIVGLAAAMERCAALMAEEGPRLAALRDRLWQRLEEGLPGIRRNAAEAPALPHTLSVTFAGVTGEALLHAMGDVYASSGAACSSAEPEPSHVLRAMGLDDDEARCSLRLGLGRFTTAEEIERAADRIIGCARALRA